MALVALPGQPIALIGAGYYTTQGQPTTASATVDATNEAVIFIGHVVTSDGGSHTINTTGSSSLGWRTGNVTFADVGTTVVVGLAAVDTSAGPPGRAVNVSDVITFDVSRPITGGSSGITANAWQTHVPTTGSKTIANGGLVAFAVQMTGRGGTDSIIATLGSPNVSNQLPSVTTFTTGYSNATATPIAVITFSDGVLGFFYGSDVFNTVTSRTWNSASATKEYGQLFNLPFSTMIHGVYGWIVPSADFDVVLYSDPLGTPVAQKTVAIDANWMAAAFGKRFIVPFSTPYSTEANQDIAVVLKPGASNISTYFKTLQSATHRLSDPYGTSGYGISRASGAFANANSNLDQYYVGLVAGGFDVGGAAGRVARVNDTSVVA